MCVFSAQAAGRRIRSVEKVSGTNIFARSAYGNGNQFLVYSMNLSSRIDLAMILPLPVPPGSLEDAVRFISFKEYPDFFQDMKEGFPEYPPVTRSAGLKSIQAPALARPKLQVHEVGDFEASYVPTVNDWDRLDEWFRVPPGLFAAVPAYREYGFAVFKLKATRLKSWFGFFGGKSGTKTIHPMAFEFPRADPDKLFFPTVHVHDGQFHPTADFDHMLYCQMLKPEELPGWRRSEGLARSFLSVSKGNGVFDPDHVCYKRNVRGKQKNEDILLADGK